MFFLEVLEGLSGGLQCLGARRRLRRIELADLLLHLPLFFLCFELVLGQQLASPGEHFFLEGEICLSPGEVHLPHVQGQLLLLKVFLGEGDVAGLALELLLPFLQPFHGLHLLGPLGFQSLVQSTQLGLVLCREGLPLGNGFLPPRHFLLPLGHLQLPGTHPLEVSLVLLAVPLELGPLGGELSGHHLGALLQLGAPVAEALVLSFKRLSLPQDCCLSFTKDLVGMRQHAGRGTGAASCSTPDRSRRLNTTSISSGASEGLELDAPPVSPPVSRVDANPLAGTSSTTVMPPDAAAGPPVGAWEAAGAVLAVAGSEPLAALSVDSCC
jgi:hypothetical protein